MKKLILIMSCVVSMASLAAPRGNQVADLYTETAKNLVVTDEMVSDLATVLKKIEAEDKAEKRVKREETCIAGTLGCCYLLGCLICCPCVCGVMCQAIYKEERSQ